MVFITKYIYYLIFIANVSWLYAAGIDSTNQKKYQIGALSGFNYISHSTNLPIIWGNSSCGNFTDGESWGYLLGLSGSYNIYKGIIFVDARLIYQSVPIDLALVKSDFRVFNPLQRIYEPLNLRNQFTSEMTYIFLEPGIIIKPFINIPLKARIAVNLGNPIVENSYSSSEEIVSPRFFTFDDLTQKHITQQGKLNNAGTSISALGGLTYEHHIGKDLYLNFELYYSYPLNSNLNDYTWEASKIGTNISLNYAFDFEHENIPPIIIKEPEKVEESIVDASPIPKNESPEMELTPGTLNILETVVTQTYPLLPYLFFDSLSYVLDEKYLKNNSIDFDEKNVPKEALSIYYSLLNIIGDRLKKAKDSKIQVIGMTDGKELPELSQRLELATKRAENVKKYLVNSFNLSPHQIEISAKDVPEMLTSISHKEGNEENRRVEITTENYEILKPLIHSRFNENELINKEIVVLLQNQDKFIDWKLELVSNSSIIASISGGKPDNNLVKIEITDYIREKILDAIQKNLSLKIKITTNSKDNTFTKEYDVIIYKEKNKFELGRLNLIVFDYDKYEINKINQDIIAKFVAGSINDNSKVKIVGSTDKLGEKLYNQKLSEDRANEVYKYLKKIKPSTNYTEIKGIGFSKLPYDNQLSEGRFYCRTVLIEVTSPIK